MAYDEEAVAWIHAQVEPAGELELVHELPWGTVYRVPVGGGVAWFKACAPVQAFEFKELRVLDAIPEEERPRLAPDLPMLLAHCVEATER